MHTCTADNADVSDHNAYILHTYSAQSVPEDSSATPSKAAASGPALLARVTDADSTDGSPKIHVGQMVSNTQSSMQLSNIMKTNQLFEQGSNGLAQEVHSSTAQNHGGQHSAVVLLLAQSAW